VLWVEGTVSAKAQWWEVPEEQQGGPRQADHEDQEKPSVPHVESPRNVTW
jgi:hypothetical protein